MTNDELGLSFWEIDDALSVTVKLSNREAFGVIVNDLMAKRNGCKDSEMRAAFDKVILAYYLTPEEHEQMSLGT